MSFTKPQHKEILMKKHTIILTIGILISKLFGIVRETVLASNYGITAYADIYKVTNDIPTVIFGFVAAGIVTTFIPIYSKIRENKSEAEADAYLSNLTNIMLAVSIVLCVFGFIFADFLISIFAVGFTGETAVIATSFLRVTIFSVLFLSTKSLLEGFLQIKQRFLTTVMAGISMNIVVISSIIISGIYETPILMAYGIVLSVIIQTLIGVIISYRVGYRHKKIFRPTDDSVIDMFKMAAPIIVGSSIDQINKLLDTTIASSVGVGAIATLGYAVRISDSILGIFVTSISSVLYPSLARQASQGRIEELKVTVRKTMNTINILIIPASIGLMILSEPIVALVYRNLSPVAAQMTSAALFFYTVGTVGYGLRQILVRTFYALHDSITPVISGIIAIVINVTLNLLLAPKMGVGGLALATSGSALVSVFILYIALSRKIGSLGTREFLFTSAKISLAAILMGFVVIAVNNSISGNTGMFISIGAGALVYAIAIYFLKIEETDQIIRQIKKKLKIGK